MRDSSDEKQTMKMYAGTPHKNRSNAKPFQTSKKINKSHPQVDETKLWNQMSKTMSHFSEVQEEEDKLSPGEFEEDKEDLDDNASSNDEEGEPEKSIDDYLEYDLELNKKVDYENMIAEVEKKIEYRKNSKFKMNAILKQLVSKMKRRYQTEKYDLDLTYITPNIIAMGFPAFNVERFFRNSMNDVQKFFHERHANHYKVLILNQDFIFRDNHPPPFKMIYDFCRDLDKYLKEDSQNVAAIHCKAGKKRFETAIDSLIFYGMSRTKNGKGVTIPSQIRYVHYFEKMMKKKITTMPIHPAKIDKIRFITIPNCAKVYYTISSQGLTYKSFDFENPCLLNKSLPFYEFIVKELCYIYNDVLIEFFQKSMMGKEKLFHLWFHTSFINDNGLLIVSRNMLDKAGKDKNHKKFSKNFRVEIELSFTDKFTIKDNVLMPEEDDILKQFLDFANDMPLIYRKLSI